MESLDFKDLVGTTIFSKCKLNDAGKIGQLMASAGGLEFTNSSKPLMFPWESVDQFVPKWLGIKATVLVKAPSVCVFYGRDVSVTDFDRLPTIRRYGAELTIPGVQRHLLADVVDGIGWAPSVGSKVKVTLSDESLVLEDFDSNRFELPFTALADVQIRGFTSKSNFGLFGGGFGLKGAAEGIAIAAVVNRLTTKSKSWVLISVASDLGRAVLLILDAQEMPVKNFFRQAQDRALQLSRSADDDTKDGLVTSLERIADLYERGLLTDDEFLAMKKGLLG